ncbi:hypothetical protein JNUCC64_05885 [Streptomyces sp. JNUCC 64]
MRRLTSTALVTALGATALVVPATAAHADTLIRTDLGVAAVGPATATPGDTVTYTLKVTNWGERTASALVLLDLPTGTTDATYEDRPVVGGLVLVNNLPPDQTDTLRITAKLGDHGGAQRFPASFRISQGDSDFPLYKETNPDNDTATVVIKKAGRTVGPRLGMKGTVKATQRVGRPHLHRVTLTNTGDEPTEPLSLTGVMHPKSEDVTLVKGVADAVRGSFTPTALNYTLPALEPGASRVITVVARTTDKPGGFGGSYAVGGGTQDVALDLRDGALPGEPRG